MPEFSPEISYGPYSAGMQVEAGGSYRTIKGLGFPSFEINTLGGALPSTVAFARTTSGTFINRFGLIETAGVNVARFEYNPTTLAALGLLIEGARTNLVLHSNNMTNAAWVKTTMTAALTAQGPDGVANSATTLTATAGNATSLQAIVDAAADRITSCWIKRRTGSGTIELTQDNGLTWTPVTVTAAWTRVSIPAVNSANPTVGVRIVTNGDAIDISHFQHELGTFISSAIVTTTAAVLRDYDSVSVTGSNFTSWFNASEFSVYAELDGAAPTLNSTTAWSISDGTNSNRYACIFGSGFQLFVANGGATQADLTSSIPTAGSNKAAWGVKLNDFAVTYNNTSPATDVSGTLPTVNALYLGASALGTNNHLFGHIRRWAFYPVKLSNTQLQALTV